MAKGSEADDDNVAGYSRAAAKADRRYSRHERENRFLVKRSEDFEVIDEVFDMPTLLVIRDMINNGTLASMKSHFASGKESKVYTALTRSGELVAVKIFLTVSAEFKNRMRYIAGDPRFEGIKKGSTRELISAWARKEFRNLQAATKCGVSVPHPISVRKNVLVMDFVEADDNDEEAKDSRRPAGSIADGNVNSEDYFFVMKQVELLYQCAELVHADLSEYNILKTRAGKLVLIDFGSAVSARHPNSKQFLLRDLINLNRFFLKWGIETVDPAFALRTITGVSAS